MTVQYTILGPIMPRDVITCPGAVAARIHCAGLCRHSDSDVFQMLPMPARALWRRILTADTSVPHLCTRKTLLSTVAAQSRSSFTTMASQVPSIPRQSASVIVVNPQNEVLLVQRNPKSQSFAGAHVRSNSSDLSVD